MNDINSEFRKINESLITDLRKRGLTESNKVEQPRRLNESGIEKMARNEVGDGKTPNKYFLSIGNEYDVFADSEMMGASEYLKKFKSKYKMIGVYDSYKEAQSEANSYSLGDKSNGMMVHRVTIEDRISGVVFERVTELDPDTLKTYEREHDDIGFTKSTLGKAFK